MAWERQTNPFLLCRDVETFLEAKQGWAGFKVQYGLR